MNALVSTFADRDFRGDEYWSLSTYSEVDVSQPALARAERFKQLLRAIALLPELAESRGYASVSRKSLQLAAAFVRALPENRMLPRVAVDEDGDVLMTWDGPPPYCALTIERSVLHMVANPGANSTHVAPTPYNGGRIPPRLLQHIPERGKG